TRSAEAPLYLLRFLRPNQPRRCAQLAPDRHAEVSTMLAASADVTSAPNASTRTAFGEADRSALLKQCTKPCAAINSTAFVRFPRLDGRDVAAVEGFA